MLSLKDLLNLNYLQGPGRWEFFGYSKEQLKSNVIKDLLILPIWLLGHFILGFQPKRWFPGKNKIMFYFLTKNNYDVLKPVQELIPNSYLITTKTQLKNGYLLPMWFFYFVSLFFVPTMLYYYFISKGETRTSISAFFKEYLVTFGYYYALGVYLRVILPSALIVANDHVSAPRVLVKVCKELGIPTFYLTHGSINSEKDAAPIEVDFALLEGRYTMEIYKKSGIQKKCKIFLVGRPFFDKTFINKNSSRNVSRIGLCMNQLDPLEFIIPIYQSIQKEFPNFTIILRPHTGMNKRYFKNLSSELKIEYSDSTVENSMDFMTRVDAVIAGRSSVLLDAAIMNVYPIYYDYFRNKEESFSFVHDGLADYVSSESELVDLLSKIYKNKPQVRMRAKSRCATLGTIYDGSSSKLTSDLINKLISGEDIDYKIWNRIKDIDIEAYEPQTN